NGTIRLSGESGCEGHLEVRYQHTWSRVLLDSWSIREASVSLRLVGDEGGCAGRLELFHQSSWWTVCDDSWDLNDAQVVCRQLGCGAAQEAHGNAAFGRGNGPIWLNEVKCRGDELHLLDCPHPLQDHTTSCSHKEDAGVTCEDSDVRLVNGNSPCEGRVEILHEGQWGTVCGGGWDINDASVVCRQVFCGDAVAAPLNSYFGAGTGKIWIVGVNCGGSESTLKDCGHGGWGNVYGCEHVYDCLFQVTENAYDYHKIIKYISSKNNQ
uniref:SRCR domain-containing protein n=1 Tax=Scleropages formosus TaxID=113540 RepID=A0A8C9WEG9_SCLFO